jgi:hypothetical protein
MDIEKNLTWHPSFNNQIDIKDGNFEVTLTSAEDEIEIVCDWDYGYGGRGTERIALSRKLLESLLKELDNSIK